MLLSDTSLLLQCPHARVFHQLHHQYRHSHRLPEEPESGTCSPFWPNSLVIHTSVIGRSTWVLPQIASIPHAIRRLRTQQPKY